MGVLATVGRAWMAVFPACVVPGGLSLTCLESPHSLLGETLGNQPQKPFPSPSCVSAEELLSLTVCTTHG